MAGDDTREDRRSAWPIAQAVVSGAQRWEYKVLRRHGVGKEFHLELEKALNKFGGDGWEVCGLTVTEGSDWALGMNGYTVVFKRPFVRAELRTPAAPDADEGEEVPGSIA